MPDAMVTGRLSEQKKQQGNAILHAAGLTASQAINFLYDRLIKDQSARFLMDDRPKPSPEQLVSALDFVDSLVVPQPTRFDEMSDRAIKAERLRARGLLDE